MTLREIELNACDRLIVFAPHPDDESLACGGLIQRAVELGATIMVVIATGGDANPWPQRFAERRWRIDASASVRWASRRRGEAEAALSLLGLSGRKPVFLGWEDQGLTTRLMEEGNASICRLRDILLQFEPTIIAMPSHQDSHPDHSALALLLRAAIAAVSCPARCLTYWLHGRNAGFIPTLKLDLSDREVSGKRAAALAHGSQTYFGTSRLLRFVGPTEQFIEVRQVVSPPCDEWHWDFVASGLFNRIAVRCLRVVAISCDGELHAATWPLRPGAIKGLSLKRRGALRLEATVSAPWSKPAWLVAKLENGHGLLVYDAMHWTESTQGPGLANSRPAGASFEHAPMASFVPASAAADVETTAET